MRAVPWLTVDQVLQYTMSISRHTPWLQSGLHLTDLPVCQWFHNYGRSDLRLRWLKGARTMR
jgi:hypothetical protein